MRGFSGMKLLAEGYFVDSTIRSLIASRAPSRDILEAQKQQGGKTLLQHAWEAAARGEVSLAEVLSFSEQEKSSLTVLNNA
jgi:type II secretory ATPase GspE/PulE/Tfp pilus assembly ATPase PilB-like protein